MENKARHKVLTRYLNGECTAEERAVVEQWYRSLDTMDDDSRLFDFDEEVELERKMLIKIQQRLSVPQNNVEAGNGRARFFTPMRVAAAALILFVAGATWTLLRGQASGLPLVYEGETANGMVTLQNRSNHVEEHRLPDGSLIKLQPFGTIIYPKQFASGKREVRLIGEAFFDVTKDKTRPFIINAHDVLVKVLGTSFNIIAYENDSEVKVAVRTGRVSVTRPANNASHGTTNEVILTPNQQVVYNTLKENFSKQIVPSPRIILEKPTLIRMKYEAAPVDKIFKVLEENYGIDIVFDPLVLSSCTLTTTMEEEGFYERIEVICQAIGATFEVQDARVLIKSAGCQELNN